ncbi:hypothetical protein JCM17844_25430 [Iodidimonas gelatinilytica]|uniref:DUF3012 domain-containing protein n=1 Tax=Iodidimonas gelatinilytica TaxID=1236966 RepID=A0A5A7MSX1_9PROT|nr:DUF3012 domain-containing protein [Iodidimonas gelatinilytica]GEQ98906.1 hypothetical protein JCM17844_25430 [Iodidimonas gelatinilytica]GER01700.1 hypothetical protein JCM17845_23230 [Iodidimonas gelatinilytica]
MIKTPLKITAIALTFGLLGACDAVPGSDAWCEKMAKSDKTSWSAEDAKTFADECVAEPAKEKIDDTMDDLQNN